jgi:hypothetical protein
MDINGESVKGNPTIRMLSYTPKVNYFLCRAVKCIFISQRRKGQEVTYFHPKVWGFKNINANVIKTFYFLF